MSKLALPAFPSQVQRTAVDDRSGGAVRPFGLTTALPVQHAQEGTDTMLGLALCPERQITVTESGQPFIHEPSMKTEFTSQTQTREDMQLATDTETDTD